MYDLQGKPADAADEPTMELAICNPRCNPVTTGKRFRAS